MVNIRGYLLSVVSAALLSALVLSLLQKKGTAFVVARLLIGLFLGITVLAPWTKIEITDSIANISSIQDNADELVEMGKRLSDDSVMVIIKEKTQAYILDKASTMGLVLQAEILFEEDQLLQPYAVNLTGDASPYHRATLQQYIENEIGIPKERQTWN